MDVSKSFAYTHKHDLIHGNFNLSKVIAQKFKNSKNITNNKHSQNKIYEDINFIVSNYEPYIIYK